MVQTICTEHMVPNVTWIINVWYSYQTHLQKFNAKLNTVARIVMHKNKDCSKTLLDDTKIFEIYLSVFKNFAVQIRVSLNYIFTSMIVASYILELILKKCEPTTTLNEIHGCNAKTKRNIMDPKKCTHQTLQ